MKITPIKIILADDHEIFRDGFRVMIRKQPSVTIVGEAADGKELIALAHELMPDVIVTDIKMPEMDGIEAAKKLTKQLPHIGIIALSMFDEENLILEMLEAGAKGYLLKNAHKDEIIAAIKAVNSNHTYYCELSSLKLASLIGRSKRISIPKEEEPGFTEKEKEVIKCICEQMTTKEIASQLNLSVRTIEGYRDRIQEKIGAKNSAGIVVYAIRHNIYNFE